MLRPRLAQRRGRSQSPNAMRHPPQAWRNAPPCRTQRIGSNHFRPTRVATPGGCTMARIGESADLFKCSFCGKSQKQVQQLIAGPGVYICDECVELCNEIIEERMAESSTGVVSDFDLPKP